MTHERPVSLSSARFEKRTVQASDSINVCCETRPVGPLTCRSYVELCSSNGQSIELPCKGCTCMNYAPAVSN